jgi:hypothetical protein
VPDQERDTPRDDERREGGVPFAAAGVVDGAGLSDDVTATLNPVAADAETTARMQGGTHDPLPPLPPRPADSAAKGEWLDYVTALGGDGRFAAGESEHWTGVGYAQATGLTVGELQALASWLGG